MSEDFNKTFERRPANKRNFLWIGLEETSNEVSVNVSPESDAKQPKSGLTFIPLDDNTVFDFSDENIENQTKKLKKTEQTFNWVPFGENFANTGPESNSFVVPQTLPSKLKKKLTPLKITPARRSSGGSSSSLRRATFRVKPNARHHLNFLSITTTKKRRSSGSQSSAFKNLSTPKTKSSLMEAQTPSSLIKSCLGVEDIQYISWINAMLASKSDERSDKIDSNQLILDCFNSNKTSLTVCPTNEKMSVETYRESVKWNQLRSAANSLYRSEDVLKINRKIMSDIKSDKYFVRKDRAIHADTGIRKHILDLLLSYNPLWLRIGLETVFQQKIVITSHSMRLSLGKFIAENFLVSKQLMSRYGHKTVTHFFKDEQHIIAAKKYILSKFLLLLNFLDRAKKVCLIEHNPCLFRKTSRHKSTMDLIIAFGRDYITGVGDITKHLRKTGFSIDYKQMAIEEFDFEVNNLAVDLRCGIRLARLAEITTDNKDLLSKLLYPANNITRKQHNVDTAFKAFADIVPKGITPKDIVFGHRKKTFELLDAIIFKHKTDQILMEQKILEESVLFIQRLFRRKRQMKVRLQKICWIQRKFRANKLMKTQREYYLKLKSNTLKVQTIFRRKLIEIRRRRAVIKIQSLWRGFSTRKRIREEKKKLENTVIWIQTKFRANKLMKTQREYYLKLKSNTLKVQTIFRIKLIEIRRRRAVIKIQSLWRGFSTRRRIREEIEKIERTVIWIQRKFRANKEMKTQREYYLKLKSNTLKVQTIFRLKLIEIRRRRAVIKIQSLWRGFSTRKRIREEKKKLENTVIWIQSRIRAKKLMETEREYYLKLKSNTIRVQKIFRNKLIERRRKAVIKIQSLWRGYWTRKCIHEENEKVEMAFIKVKKSNSLAKDEMRLGIITYNSLKNLLKYDSLLKLSHDLLSLDKTTELSPESCETIAKYGAVPILLQILNESNRSEPHKMIISLTINILLHLAKYPKTLPNLVSNSQTMDTLFKIIKNFSTNAVQISKQNEMISKLFTLLWILLKDDTILEKTKCDKRKMDAIKQIYEYSKREKGFINIKNSKGMVKKDYNFVPIWQIAKNNIFEFNNHLVAILAIVRRLNIH